MPKFFKTLVEPFVLSLAALITLSLLYFKISVTTYQQIIVVLMIALLIGFSRILSGSAKISSKNQLSSILNYLILFISALIVQLLVFSTGGIYSPFLILLHLFTLGTSFLVSLKSSVSFLTFSLLILITNLWINPDQLRLIKDDPGTVLLYFASMVVIIPLANLLASKYHLKEQLSSILSKQVKVGESILESLNELVIVTDTNLQIISVNEAVKRMFNLNDAEVANKNMLDIVKIKDNFGKDASLQSLSVDKVLVEGNTRIVSGFLLYTPARVIPFNITVQIRPIKDAEAKVDQLSFVITEGNRIGDLSTHLNIEEAKKRQSLRFQALQKILTSNVSSSHTTNIIGLLLEKNEQDLLNAIELEDHSMDEKITLIDVAALLRDLKNQKLKLAQSLGVDLKLLLPEKETREKSLLALKPTTLSNNNFLPSSDFLVPLSVKWFSLMVDKLLDICLLLASNQKNPYSRIYLSHTNNLLINLTISASYPLIQSQHDQDLLLSEYYGQSFESSNLNFGSGLEGFIAKTISSHLNIPILIKSHTNPSQVEFVLYLVRKAQ
ncbi:PAS domain-containing protein [Candidatus Daviesbacteria bacterium]|nr:PAS domain-containing protein [Candidatus Daviesbacteria bacterium]